MLDPHEARQQETRLAGIFLHAAGRAFVHLHVLGGPEVDALSAGVDPMGFYPYAKFAALLAAVEKRFRDMDPVLEQLGVQMMKDWYELGPGQSLVASGAAFLRFQTGSEGYRSVVQGPESAVGGFALTAIDETAGTACVRSSTPFPRAMERGVLLGGMQAPGDLAYVRVTNAEDADVFDVVFR
jgi:hypothetical protein